MPRPAPPSAPTAPRKPATIRRWVWRLVALPAVVAAAALVYAGLGPRLGLGAGEDALLFRLCGWSRTEVAEAGLWLLVLAAAGWSIPALFAWMARPPGLLRPAAVDWLRREAGPGLLITALLLAAGALGAEVWLRSTTPFAQSRSDYEFDPVEGVRFRPGSVVQHTNGLDFWTRADANSIGQLDRQPPSGPPNAACRIVFLGDSIVEAAQVTIPEKVQVQIEALAIDRLPFRLEAFAIGKSGTGQVQQLPRWRAHAAPRRPDLTVAVLVRNDLSDNHPALAALVHGMDLSAPPYPMLMPDGASGWRHQPPRPPQGRAAVQVNALGTPPSLLHQFAATRSLAYARLHGLLSLEVPGLAAWLGGAAAGQERMAALHDRLAVIEAQIGAPVFAGTPVSLLLAPSDLGQRVPAPPIAEAAWAVTAFALRHLRDEAAASGGRLVLYAAIGMRVAPQPTAEGLAQPGTAMFDHFAGIAQDLGVPLLDQEAWARAAGGRPEDGHFKRDAHWSAQGHRWAAEQLVDHLRRDTGLCARVRLN